MAHNTENQSLEGGSGQQIESSNMEILMKSIADMRQHQLLLEERLGIFPPRHNSGSAGQTLNQGDMIMPEEFSSNGSGSGTMTWNRFKDLFIDKYVPDVARDRKFYEFMSLTKGGMSVSTYNDKFTRLSRYGAELIATDEAKAKKLIRGLDPEMRKQLSYLRIKTYEDSLNRALDYEKEMEDQLATRIRERPKQFSARQGPAKRPMFSAPNKTFFRPLVKPWSTGSTSVPRTARPPT
ncbi:hypothetical protein MKW98_028259, partial [Papaver atlanticum]